MVQELDPNLYGSDDERYFIRLLPVIKSRDGKKLRTPARIGAKTGIIEVSKEAFDNMTVPMRFAILMHEFSHFYLNDEMKDEMEADLNGLLIYLGLGYPRIEAYQAFLETFTKSPSPLNKQRYDLINKFIEDFESMNMVIK
jgi:Zn-dependent protease with chaperone function